MNLLVKMIKKRLFLTLVTVCANGILIGVILWWNAQLSGIINTISKGNTLPMNTIVSAIFIMVVMCAANFIKTYISGFTYEVLTHDLRMGYANATL